MLRLIPALALLTACSPGAEMPNALPATSMTPTEVIGFYQEMGFFDGVTPEEVIEAYLVDWGELPDPWQKWDDAFLLSYSASRVWADDAEADVCAENKVYTGVLPAWAEASQGAFAPENIEERWESETGPVHLSFTLDGTARTLSPRYLDDWLDVDVLAQANEWLADRAYTGFSDGNYSLVLCLTPEERERMERVRTFPFTW